MGIHNKGTLTMRAIITTYHGPTSSRGSYISAKAEGVPAKRFPTVSMTDDTDVGPFGIEGWHRQAAERYAAGLGWFDERHVIETGMLPNQTSYAHLIRLSTTRGTTRNNFSGTTWGEWYRATGDAPLVYSRRELERAWAGDSDPSDWKAAAERKLAKARKSRKAG